MVGALAVVTMLLLPAAGVGFGLLGFILANTAWAHLRRGDRRRPLTVFGQILNATAVVVSIVLLVIVLAVR